MYPNCGTDVTELMKNADMAMYRAKANGKNRFVFFSKEMSIAQNEIQFLEGELSKALQQNEFFLEYQPQVSTKQKNYWFRSINSLETSKAWYRIPGPIYSSSRGNWIHY